MTRDRTDIVTIMLSLLTAWNRRPCTSGNHTYIYRHAWGAIEAVWTINIQDGWINLESPLNDHERCEAIEQNFDL